MAAPRMKVLITRTAAESAVLAERLNAAGGFEPLICPALAIVPVADPTPLDAALAHLDRYRLVVFVSPNAIGYALARLSSPWPVAVEIGVMGPGSAATLAARGIAPPTHVVHVPDGRYDSEALYATLDPDHIAGSRVLIIKGNGGRPWLAERLMAGGARVDLVESYRREQGRPDATVAAAVAGLVKAGEPAAVVVTSSEALARLPALLTGLAGPAAADWLATCTLYVPHARIAENATAAGLPRVVLTGPGEENIVRTLESCHP